MSISVVQRKGHVISHALKEKISFGIRILIMVVLLAYVFVGFPHYYPLPEITSQISAAILTFFGLEAIPYTHYLIVQGIPVMEVSAECSGIIILMVFSLTIFLMPHFPLKPRIASFFFVPFIFLGNILRIVIDAWTGITFSIEALHLFHDTIGQVFIFFWAIVLYIIWLRVFGNFPAEERIIHPDGYD